MEAVDISRWLAELGLAQYADSFAENDIDSDVLADLSDSDLKELGLSLGHRRKLLKAVAALEPNAAQVAPTVNAPAGESDAERRQLTVMFVDLVGSTALSSRLDPEVMRDIIAHYQNLVAGEVTRFEGHVAKYMGDGVLCYFGWPRAHEDDAERAARAGLAIMNAMLDMAAPDGEALRARAGIATGLVVVGDLIGTAAAQEQAVVGDTPNLAARLQDLAEPGQVVLAETTRRLMGNLFALKDLGARKLKGISAETKAFVVEGERAVESRFDARQAAGVTAMVGREQELALLTERWRQAQAGEGQMVLLTGEAGIGKSRIARGLIDTVSGDDHFRINYQCSPYHTDSALYPATQQLIMAAGFSAEDTAETRLDKLEALLRQATDDITTAAPIIAGLLGLGEVAEARHGLLDLSPQQRRTHTLETLASQLIGLSREKPVLLVLEDAHWIDPTTLELVELCLNRIAHRPVMLMITARPTMQHRFGGHPIVTRLALNRLGRGQIMEIVERITDGKALPEELVEEIVAKTDGMPLFVEELTKTVLESGMLKEIGGILVLDGPVDRMAIPSSLHDSLMARLDRLQPVKEVAQTAACIGREFGYELLAAVSPLAEAELGDALEQLVEAELVFRRGVPPDASYSFKHALVRDAAYESLLKAKRQQIHGRLFGALEESADIQPELLAQHAEHAGETEKAVGYSQKAGQAALARPAYEEAIGNFNNAIRLVQGMENSDRRWAETELELQVELGQALIAKRGYGAESTMRAFERASELAESIGDTPLRFPVYYGSWVVHYLRAEHAAALDKAGKIVALAGVTNEPTPSLTAHRILGTSQFAVGRFTEARQSLDIALGLLKPMEHRVLANRFGQDPYAATLCYWALSAWSLGQIDQARENAAKAKSVTDEFVHVNTACYVAVHKCVLAICQRDEEEIERNADWVSNLSAKHGMALWKLYGGCFQGLLRARRGDIIQFSDALDAYWSSDSWLFAPILKTVQAEAFLNAGNLDGAGEAIGQAREVIALRGERWPEAETLRVEGDWHLKQSKKDLAEASYLQAIDIARKQEARSWELRAATSLAKLWADEGDRRKARDLLAPIQGWFTEGLDSPDLQDASTVLESLD
jgi:class 3 adenylate cyclase/tetratricopeptide (TPR) repeat protein